MKTSKEILSSSKPDRKTDQVKCPFICIILIKLSYLSIIVAEKSPTSLKKIYVLGCPMIGNGVTGVQTNTQSEIK